MYPLDGIRTLPPTASDLLAGIHSCFLFSNQGGGYGSSLMGFFYIKKKKPQQYDTHKENVKSLKSVSLSQQTRMKIK